MFVQGSHNYAAPKGSIIPESKLPPKVGLAFGPSALRIAESDPGSFDYFEIPFELLESNPSLIERVRDCELILHCASLSIAGTVDPSPKVLERIQYWLTETRSLWLGEHLAFLLAEKPRGEDSRCGDPYGEPYNIGFTVAPPMNQESVQQICKNLNKYSNYFSVPLLVENSPLYFGLPGTDMDQITFINEVLLGSSAGLLLDLTHLIITARNQGFSPSEALDRLPLDRVIEVHVSGIEDTAGVLWDHHASRVPLLVLELLPKVAQSPSVRAVTLEYNWISDFSDDAIREEISLIRQQLAK